MSKPVNASKKVWIETFGCQMNINDTEKMYRLLHQMAYEPTTQPQEADLILLNTCTIREKAEHKVFSSLGRLKEFKVARPDVMIGVAGCMAQMLGEKIRKRAPYVDLVFGTYAIHKLPEMISKLVNHSINDGERPGLVETGKLMPNDFDFLPLQPDDLLSPGVNQDEVIKHVTIQNGCNKNCSYCIVPSVRGREISRPVTQIVEEIRQLVERGVQEVVLVGQTVNSYGKGSATDFPALLRIIDGIDGLKRIRFVTSHPRDLSEELMQAMTECSKVCEHLHLPVQSGSDSILRKMYRGYTYEKYLTKVRQLRQLIPGLSLTTDIIVGFPGESEEDFAATMRLVEEVGFDNSFCFIYSPRPFTEAAEWPEQVPLAVARERLYRLLALQNRITAEHLQRLLDHEVEVLVEGKAKVADIDAPRTLRRLSGRTRTNWNVFFDGPEMPSALSNRLKGNLLQVKIDRVLAHSLQGKIVVQ